ncbi:uncharacterized protein LOC127006950 isoform X2 [Eriocheir sinensis]|nr:uncharacterized protein LOC127006950 isoform X2 [Eriocheir sinensis]
MVGKCMEELLSLHEDGEKGKRKKLAKEMLDALLSSSSSSSSSSFSPSFSSSIWSSKSSYPPLALAVTHLGCEEALQHHPSLPSDLTYSLGVNHLAPPGTAVYKVFLAQLREASWRTHFLAPICKALCSHDRLTQQHILTLWLPPTLRRFPEVHWALLAPCGTDTPSWLARMALLRVARSVGSLHLEGKKRDVSGTNWHSGMLSARDMEREKSASLKVMDEGLLSARDEGESAKEERPGKERKEEEEEARKEEKEGRIVEDERQEGEKNRKRSQEMENKDEKEENIDKKDIKEEEEGNINKNEPKEDEKEENKGKEKEEEEENEEEEEDHNPQIHHYITMALRHRDENVRLEALHLLCQTQKTSQPVTPFEAQCLKTFLTHNLNIDSAPFRQGLLKCVAALMVRLRGATASVCKSGGANVTKRSRGASKSKGQVGKGTKGMGKGYLGSVGTLGSGAVPREEKKGINCDESSRKKEVEGKKMEVEEEEKGKIEEKEEEEEEEEEGVLSTSANIILGLAREVHRGMAPDSNYQRRILALQLYKEILVALLPLVAHPSLGKRSNTSPEPLVTYLNTLTEKKKGVWRNSTCQSCGESALEDEGVRCEKDVFGQLHVTSPQEKDVACQLHVTLSHKDKSFGVDKNMSGQSHVTPSCNAYKGLENSIETPLDCNEDCEKGETASQPLMKSVVSTQGDREPSNQSAMGALNQAFVDTHEEKDPSNQLLLHTYGNKGPQIQPSQPFLDTHVNKESFNQPSTDTHGNKGSQNQPFLDTHRNKGPQNKPFQTFLNIHGSKGSQIHPSQPFLDTHGDKGPLNQPFLDLKYPWTLTTLLQLAQDEMSDIRTEACEIICLFASQGMHLSASEGKEWMRCALRLCDSPKASDAESGGTLALTVALLLPRECQGDVLEAVFGVEMKGSGGGCGTHSPSLVECLLARVERQFGAAQNNLLSAARHTPIHGTLQALGRCISQAEEGTGKENGSASTHPSDLPYRLASLLQQLVEFVLDTLASTSLLGAAVPPSFAEMGEAVGRVVEKGKEEEEEVEKDPSLSSVSSLLEEEEEEEEEEEKEGGLLSSDHVLVLSCCWQILKSCCEVTCQAVHLFSHDPKAIDDLIRAVVVRVLLGTRHKGAMEAARATYASLWAKLLLKSAAWRGSCGTVDPRLVNILHRQVGEVVSSLGSPSHTSVTRRAAGVAMMVQAACGAAPRTTTSLLTTTLATLITIASTEVALDEAGTTDAPPALALHILQSLALHSPLGPFLRPHLTPLTNCCLHAFSSPSWAIRNAALQLFGSLVSCLVGQKKVRDDASTLNSLTAPEFLSRHPSLALYFLEALEGDSGCREDEDDDSLTRENKTHTSQHTHTKTHTHIHSELQGKRTHKQADTHTCTHSETHIHTQAAVSHITRASILVPVLSLVARLSPGTGLQQNPQLAKTLHRLWCATACFLASPVHGVRRLAASALVSLTPSDMALDQSLGILLKVSDHHTPTNLLNGLLMLLFSFLQTYPKLATDARLRDHGTEALSWLLGPKNKCHVNTALALKIMMALGIKEVDTLHMEAPMPSLPGAAECHLTHTLLQLALRPECTIENIFLANPPADSDILDGCSSAILAKIKECQCSVRLLKYESLLWCRLEDYTLSPKAVAALLSLLSAVMEREESTSLSLPNHRLRLVLACMEGKQGSRASCAALVLTAHLLRKPHVTHGTLKAFTAAITRHSQPTTSEDHRLAASVALSIAINPLLCQCQCVDLALKEQLIMATVALLQDEDSGIRDSAADIVVALLKPSHSPSKVPHELQPSPSHPNLALYELLQWLAEECISAEDWGLLRILWYLGSGQSMLASSCTAVSLTGNNTRLFQSHSANLYHEPKQLSVMVGEAVMVAVRRVTVRHKECYHLHNTTEKKEADEVLLAKQCKECNHLHKTSESERVGESLLAGVHGLTGQCREYDHPPKTTENEGRGELKHILDGSKKIPQNLNHCTLHKKNGEENVTTLRENYTQKQTTRNCTQMKIPDWLEEERLKLNIRGETLHTLTSEHSLWHNRLLATEAGVYVVACRVFEYLCGVFGVSSKLAYPLAWGEKGYSVVNGAR